jgi:hypothetical protein
LPCVPEEKKVIEEMLAMQRRHSIVTFAVENCALGIKKLVLTNGNIANPDGYGRWY